MPYTYNRNKNTDIFDAVKSPSCPPKHPLPQKNLRALCDNSRPHLFRTFCLKHLILQPCISISISLLLYPKTEIYNYESFD